MPKPFKKKYRKPGKYKKQTPSELARRLTPVGEKYYGDYPKRAKEYPYTFEKEAAIAINIWRALRMRYGMEDKLIDGKYFSSYPSGPIESINDTAIKMAEMMGAKKELFEVMFDFPVFKLFVVDLDSWPQALERALPPSRELTEVSNPPIEQPKKKGK